MSIGLEAQVRAIADAMMKRDKEALAAYFIEYYFENREHLIEYQSLYKMRNWDKVASYKAAHYQKNRDAIDAKHKAWYMENREKVAAYKKEYFQANKESVQEKRRNYRAANKEKVAEQSRRYRAENLMEIKAKAKGSHSARYLPIVRDGYIGTAKLSEDNVRSIRTRHSSGEKCASIAVDFKVSRRTISDAVRGKTWAHVI